MGARWQALHSRAAAGELAGWAHHAVLTSGGQRYRAFGVEVLQGLGFLGSVLGVSSAFFGKEHLLGER